MSDVLFNINSLEGSLEDKFKRIFELKKVVFDEPSESEEQKCLFIELEDAINKVQDKNFVSRVTGTAVLFGANNVLPIGYFFKAIQNADPDDTKDFFFFDVDQNTRRFKNIVQRSFRFVYFFKNQYDPDKGLINEITTSVEFET